MTRKALAQTLALLLLATATISASALAEVPPPPAPPAVVPAGPIYAVPTTADRAGRVLAPVVVDGYGPVKFLVDTGCSGTMIGLHIAQALGFNPPPVPPGAGLSADVTVNEGMMRVHDVLGPIIMPTMRVARLDMGRFQATNLLTPILSVGDRAGAGGVLGTNSLAGRRLSVNFRRDEIRIENSRRGASIGYDTVRGKIHPVGLMIVPLEIGGMVVWGMVDTGAERSMFNTHLKDALAARGKPTQLIGNIELLNLTGESRIGEVHLMPRLKIGPLSVTNLMGTLVDAHAFVALGLDDRPAFILGMDVLGVSDGFALDFGTGDLHLKMRTTASGAPPGPSRLGSLGTRAG